MSLKIEDATPADLNSLVPSQFDAFHPHDPMHMLYYPSPTPPTPEIIQRAIERQTKSFGDPEVHWIKVVDDATGESIAGAKWLFYPEADEKRWAEKVEPTWILKEDQGKGNVGAGVEDYEYVAWVMEEVQQIRREKVRGPAAFLDLLYVDPKHHRRGAGKMMVRWGLEKADELGVKAFLDSSAKGRPMYESCGFVVKERIEFEGGKARDEWAPYGKLPFLWLERESQRSS